jgi:anti-sigma factor RsiW
MTTLENDLQLLELYLDGELSQSESILLAARLSTDAPLSTELAKLQRERTVRASAMAMLEPSDMAAQQLLWRVRGAMASQQQTATEPSQRSWSPWRIASTGSAAAACLMLGFLFGRIGQRNTAVDNPAITPVAQPAGIASSQTPAGPLKTPNGFVAVGSTPKISVPITNEYGQVVAWQTFDNPEQAKNFTEDLHKAQVNSNAPVTSGQTKLAAHDEQVPF